MVEESNPLVSIVLPTYNDKEGYLHNCIQSIVSQSCSNIELLIVDDSTEEDTISTINYWEDEKEWISVFRDHPSGLIES